MCLERTIPIIHFLLLVDELRLLTIFLMIGWGIRVVGVGGGSLAFIFIKVVASLWLLETFIGECHEPLRLPLLPYQIRIRMYACRIRRQSACMACFFLFLSRFQPLDLSSHLPSFIFVVAPVLARDEGWSCCAWCGQLHAKQIDLLLDFFLPSKKKTYASNLRGIFALIREAVGFSKGIWKANVLSYSGRPNSPITAYGLSP